MKEKLAEKLNEIFAKVVDEIVSVLTEEDVPQEETNHEEKPAEEIPAPEGEIPPEEGGAPETTEQVPPAEETPAAEEKAPVEEVPPTDGSIEQALNELAAQEGGEVPPAEVPPAPESLPPAINPEEIGKLQSDLNEANKTIESLVKRIESLEEALKGAGVINNTSKVGDETPRITPNANQENEDAFDDVIAAINGK